LDKGFVPLPNADLNYPALKGQVFFNLDKKSSKHTLLSQLPFEVKEENLKSQDCHEIFE